MDDIDMNDLSRYHIDLAKVVADKKMLAVTRLLAAELLNAPYKSVGEFFESVSDSDLEVIMDAVESEGEHKHSSEMLLMAQMLYAAEGFGVEFDNIDNVTQRVNQFGVFAVVTSLHRKGLVKVHYNNMSFGEDMKDKVLVEKIDGRL